MVVKCDQRTVAQTDGLLPGREASRGHGTHGVDQEPGPRLKPVEAPRPTTGGLGLPHELPFTAEVHVASLL